MVVINRIELLFNAYETFVLPLNYMTIVWLLAVLERIELSSNAYETSVLTIELYSNNFGLLATPEKIELYETPMHFVNCVTIEPYNNKLVGVLRIELRFTG